jgi:hypothetical protein
MITELAAETVQYILNKTKKLTNFQLLALTCHHFNDMILVPEIEITSKNIPHFIFTEKWAKLLSYKNGNFAIPRNFRINHVADLYIRLICENSLYAMKMISTQQHRRSIFLKIDMNRFQMCFKDKQNYLDFCNKQGLIFKPDKIHILNQPLLILTYLFGTKDMLKILLDTNMIENIDFISNYITNTDSNISIMNLIDQYDVKNDWNMESSVYEKVVFPALFGEFKFFHNTNNKCKRRSASMFYFLFNEHKPVNMGCYYITRILNRYPKSFYERNMVENLKQKIQLYDKDNVFPIIYENITGIKIKHQLLFFVNFYDEELIRSISRHFLWDKEDIGVINKINSQYNFNFKF